MTLYTVTIKVSMLEFYEVEADTPEDAAENLDSGDFVGSDDDHRDAEVIRVKKGSTTVWRKP